MSRLSTEIDQIKPPEFKVQHGRTLPPLDRTLQAVFVGAINVGKSSLVARFVKNEVFLTTILVLFSNASFFFFSIRNIWHPPLEVRQVKHKLRTDVILSQLLFPVPR